MSPQGRKLLRRKYICTGVFFYRSKYSLLPVKHWGVVNAENRLAVDAYPLVARFVTLAHHVPVPPNKRAVRVRLKPPILCAIAPDVVQGLPSVTMEDVMILIYR